MRNGDKSGNKAVVSIVIDVGDEVADECAWYPQFTAYVFQTRFYNSAKNRLSY